MKMSVIERRPPAKLSFQIPLPSENTLISIVAVAFLILHILAGSMLLNASPTAPAISQEESRSSPYD
jgi:hypothetical protein